ncbi:patatin-like phospholipase family protein [Demequina flava]|uniref:patatin-like phospholipase family protein n=1 Tax=Demequina flava TaxID=1095025 RepID=UPI000781534B|nr:patatin-like phospholipase family protein [Demequina flava]
MTVGFVLGGGGVRGAVEVGMLRALFEAGVTPDLVVGTSIGAINGAAVAHKPSMDVIEQLETAWKSKTASTIYGEPFTKQLTRLARSRTHLNSHVPLKKLIESVLDDVRTFEDLEIPLAVCAASIERTAETWFDSGPLMNAVIASASVPAALPPTLIDGEHYVDGGVVNSIPLGEAIKRGANTVYVLQVGRIDEPLSVPTNPADVGKVTFEISRRHRFVREMSEVPEGVTVHVLPYGGPQPGDTKLGAYKDLELAQVRMNAGYEASATYLCEAGVGQ